MIGFLLPPSLYFSVSLSLPCCLPRLTEKLKGIFSPCSTNKEKTLLYRFALTCPLLSVPLFVFKSLSLHFIHTFTTHLASSPSITHKFFGDTDNSLAVSY